MKQLFSLVLFATVTLGFAQIPAGYYATATGTGFTLKTQLYNKISPHTTLIYGSGLWSLFATSDVRPDGFVWDIYSNCNFVFGPVANGGNQDDGTLGTIECQRYNKEHTFPQSWFGGQVYPMYSDAHIVMPADKKDNGMRQNLAYGMVSSTVVNPIGNGWKTGTCTTPNYPYSLQVFEPADQYKGDIARNYFYMATCYENAIGSWQTFNASGDTVLDGTNDNVFESWFLNMLLIWHNQDPVSQKEIDRNNAIYAVQGNRNPFVDHPEYVCQIWTTACANMNSTAYNMANTTVFPNPSSDQNITINSTLSIDGIQLFNVNGQIILEINNPKFENNSYTLQNLPLGFYFLKLNSNHQSVTKKIIIN
ncbi:MAG: hypothetical protein RIQ59_1217 [Bacteroidota bacterium]|jgi:endonuclease I